MKEKTYQPLVSICMPVFNGEDSIDRAIKSCINQSYKKIEIVVVDNASYDNTQKIVKEYANKDERIKYFRNKKNVGLSGNLLRSFELAKGKYVQHLGHDDWLSRNYIEEGVKNFKKYPESAAVSGKILNIEQSKENQHSFILKKEIAFKLGIYSDRYIFRNIYKNDWGAIGLLSLLRKKDVPRIKTLLLEIWEDKEYKQAYRQGLATDGVIFAKILINYEYTIFTEKSHYLKLSNPKSVSSNLGFNSEKLSDRIRFQHIFLTCHEYLYKKELKKNLSGLRIYIGSIVINEFINYLRDKLKKNNCDNTNTRREFVNFFRNYSFYQKIITFFYSLCFLIFKRTFMFIKRTLLKKVVKIDLHDNFLDSLFQFKV